MPSLQHRLNGPEHSFNVRFRHQQYLLSKVRNVTPRMPRRTYGNRRHQSAHKANRCNGGIRTVPILTDQLKGRTIEPEISSASPFAQAGVRFQAPEQTAKLVVLS
jgi:hypothetical protein